MTSSTANVVPVPCNPKPRSRGSAWLNAVPHPYIASAAAAGLPSRLVSRFDVRADVAPASQAEASAAAAGPWKRSSNRMKISAPATEIFEPGIRTGNQPASIAIAIPTMICDWSVVASVLSWPNDHAMTDAPIANVAHQ